MRVARLLLPVLLAWTTPVFGQGLDPNEPCHMTRAGRRMAADQLSKDGHSLAGLPTSGCDLAAFHAALTRLAEVYRFALCEHAAADAGVTTEAWIPTPAEADGEDDGGEPIPKPVDLPAVSPGLPTARERIAAVRVLLEAPAWQEALRRCAERGTAAAGRGASPEPAVVGAPR